MFNELNRLADELEKNASSKLDDIASQTLQLAKQCIYMLWLLLAKEKNENYWRDIETLYKKIYKLRMKTEHYTPVNFENMPSARVSLNRRLIKYFEQMENNVPVEERVKLSSEEQRIVDNTLETKKIRKEIDFDQTNISGFDIFSLSARVSR